MEAVVHNTGAQATSKVDTRTPLPLKPSEKPSTPITDSFLVEARMLSNQHVLYDNALTAEKSSHEIEHGHQKSPEYRQSHIYEDLAEFELPTSLPPVVDSRTRAPRLFGLLAYSSEQPRVRAASKRRQAALLVQ